MCQFLANLEDLSTLTSRCERPAYVQIMQLHSTVTKLYGYTHMKFTPYTNMTFEVIGVTRHPRNRDKLTRRACISPIFDLILTGQCD